MEDRKLDLSTYKGHLNLFFFEALGSFIVIIILNYAFRSGPANMVGGILICCCFCGKQTGAHLNFGVTLGLYIMNRDVNQSLRKSLPTYFFAAIIGGFGGSFFSYWLLGPYYTIVLAPADLSWSIFYVMFIEAFYSTLFLMVVFHMVNPKLTIVNNMVMGSFVCGVALYFVC